MTETWEEEAVAGMGGEGGPQAVMENVGFSRCILKVPLGQKRVSDKKSGFTNQVFFDLEAQIFPPVLLSQPFWGQDCSVMTQKINCLYLCLPLSM